MNSLSYASIFSHDTNNTNKLLTEKSFVDPQFSCLSSFHHYQHFGFDNLPLVFCIINFRASSLLQDCENS